MNIKRIIQEEIDSFDWVDTVRPLEVDDLEVGMIVIPMCHRHRLTNEGQEYKVESFSVDGDRTYVHLTLNIPLVYPLGAGDDREGFAPKLTIHSELGCTFVGV